MTAPWQPDTAGLLVLPSGRSIRGRGVRRPVPAGAAESDPTFALYLLGHCPPLVAWEHRWVRWPDFRLPADPLGAAQALREAWTRAEVDRVEIACGGGRGRTGTALACIAVLDGVPAKDAVTFVRRNYSQHAVETPWQRRFVARFG